MPAPYQQMPVYNNPGQGLYTNWAPTTFPQNQMYPNANGFVQNQNTMRQVPPPIIRVNGRAGAEAYQMEANQSALLLDETAPILWVKSTDGAGYPSLMGYTLSPLVDEQQKAMMDISSIEERLEALEQKVSRYGKSNSSNARRNAKSESRQSTERIDSVDD